MKHLNFLSKSSSRSCGHRVTTLALTVGSPSAHRRGVMLRLLSVLVLILTFGVGQMWGASVTFKASEDSGSGSINKSGITVSMSTMNRSQKDNFRCNSGTSISITSTVGNINSISFTFSGSNNGGFNTSYTGLSTTSWNSGNSSSQARITQIVVTYTAAASCDKKVTLTKGSTTNGTFVLDKSNGSYDNCDANFVVHVSNIVPASNAQYCNGINATGGYSTVTGPVDGVWTVTYTKENNITSTITPTYANKTAASISFENAGTPAPITSGYYVGDSYTLPSTNNYNCSGGKTFVGWSTVEVASTDTKPSSNFYEPGANVTLGASQTFYAVFATESGSEKSTQTVNYGFETTDDATLWTITNIDSYSSAKASGSYSGKCSVSGTNIVSPNNITYNSKLSEPVSISFKTSKTGSNTTASNYWKVQYSSNGSSYSDATDGAGPNHSALTNNTFTDAFEVDLSSYSNVYIRITHNGQSPATLIDNIVLKYKTISTTYYAYSTDCCTPLGSINGSLLVTTPTRDGATLSWPKVTNASGYEYKLGNGEWTTATVADLNNPSTSISGLDGATQYSINLRATGTGNICSEGPAMENAVQFKTLSRVSAVENNDTYGTAKVSLTNGSGWADYVDAADGTTIYLQANPNSGYTLYSWAKSTDAGSISNNQLSGSWTGDVTVTATFALAELPKLDTPTGMSSSVTATNSATVSWNAVANATGYIVTCEKTSDHSTTGIVIGSISGTSCTISGLTAGTGYTWMVLAKGNGSTNKNSDACAAQTFTTLHEYTLTYKEANGTGNGSGKVVENATSFTNTTAPSKTGYNLEGFYTTSALDVKVASNERVLVANISNWTGDGGAYTKAADADLYLKWNAKTMDVTLDNQNATTAGTAKVPGTYDQGLPSIAANLPTKTGYDFKGYFAQTGGNGKRYIKPDGTADEPWDKEVATTIYAYWTKITYTITFQNNGVTLASGGTRNVQYGNTYGDLPVLNSTYACDATSKTFIGWTIANIDGKQAAAPSLVTASTTMEAGNVILNAVWAKEGESTTTFKRLQNVSELANATKIAIVNAFANNNYIMTTSLATAQAAPSENQGKISVSDGQYWTLEAANSYWKFKTGNNYLVADGAPGSSNSEKKKTVSVQSTGNDTWEITSNSYTTNGTPVFTVRNTVNNFAGLEYSSGWCVYYATDFNTSWYTMKFYIPDVAYSDYMTACPPLTCSAPQSLTSEPGKNGATISWSAQEVGTAAKYQYAVWADGDDEPTSGYSETTELTAEVSGLMSNTDYKWKVRTVCTGEDGESEFAKSTFTTGSVALTFSVPAGVSAVAASTSASALPSAGVPSSCADCWVFAGWSSDENATSVEYAAGETYKFNGDKTLHAVYGKINGYKLIDNITDLTANEYYLITYPNDEESVDAMSTTVVETYFTNSTQETVLGSYIKKPSINAIWKLTGSSSAWTLCNEATSKYMDLSNSSAAPVASTTTDNLIITLYDAEKKQFNIRSKNTASNYLQMYNKGWGVDNDHDGYYSAYIYKRNYSPFSTNPDCSNHSVTWHIIDDTQVDENVSACDGVETLPDVDVSGVRCKTENTVFMGWSETNVGYEPISTVPTDLFTDALHAPAITEDKEFYAVFAERSGVVESKYQEITISNFTEITTNYSTTYTHTYAMPTLTSTPQNVDVEAYGVFKNNSGIQMNSGKGTYIKNTDALPGVITKIEMTWTSSGDNKPTIYVSKNSEASTSSKKLGTMDGASTSYSIDVDASKGYKYFYFDGTTVTGACYMSSFKVTYQVGEYTYDDYFTECCPQKDITLNGVVENEKVFSAKIAGEVVTKACEGETITLDYSENGHYTFNANSWLVYKTGEKTTTVTVSDNQFTMPAYPVTVEATWTPKNYKITIANAEGGSATVKESTTYSQDGDGKWIVPYGSTVTLQATPSDEYHYFSNWSLSPAVAEAAISQAEMAISMPGDITATPVFGEITQSALTIGESANYTLTATLANGDPIDDMSAIYSGTSIKVTYELIGQQEFVSWNMNDGAFTSFSTEGTTATFNMPETDLTVDLNVVAYYTLGLDVENGTISSVEIDDEPQTPPTTSYNVHEGEIIEVVATPTNDTYKFVGWEKTGIDENDFTANGAEAMLEVATSNMTLKAVFAAKETKTLTLMVCGKAQETINALEGTSIHSLVSAKTAPALTGYTFEGWSATEDGAAISALADVTLDVDMPVYAVYKKEAYYQKVTSISAGQYLIVCEDDNRAWKGSATSDGNSNAITVTISNHKIAVSEAIDAENFTISTMSGGYSILCAGGKYIYGTSGSNGVSYGNDEQLNTIIFDEDGNAIITSNTSVLRHNNSSAGIFRYYRSNSYSGQHDIQLYKKIVPEDNESNPSTVVTNGEELVIDETTTLNNLTVEAGGTVTTTNALEVKDLFLESKSGASGQISDASNLDVTGNLFMDITLFTSAEGLIDANYWYSVAVPFDVDINSGIYRLDGTTATQLHNSADFDVWYYDTEYRASSKRTGWKRLSGKMEAGKAYLIGFDDGMSNKVRFKAAEGWKDNLYTANSIPLTQASDGGDGTHSNWNGIANPTMHYIGTTADVQVFDNDNHTYSQFTNYNYVVGTAFFVKATSESFAIGDVDANNEFRAPKRESENKYEFSVRICKGEAERFDNQMYVRASEEASAEFDANRDITSMNSATAPSAMLWTENYGGKRLAIEDAPIVNNTASYVLGLYAPKAGQYRIEATDSYGNADLYLTYEGAIIWNLSMGEYEIDLEKGTTNGYGLLLQAKAPQVVTGVDEVDAETCVQKIIIDEHVFILRGGQMYDVTGKTVK